MPGTENTIKYKTEVHICKEVGIIITILHGTNWHIVYNLPSMKKTIT